MTIMPFAANEESIKGLWERIEHLRPQLADSFPSTPLAFVCWAFTSDATSFEVRDDDGKVVGWFLFTDVVPGDSAWAHVFIWEPEKTDPAELAYLAKAACGSMFRTFGLARINGLTPKTLAHARVFAERVGFKVEGHIRSALSVGGLRTDAWLTGLLPEDLQP